MWRSRARSRTKSTSRSLGAVRGVQKTFSIHSAYLLESQSENNKLNWSVWIRNKPNALIDWYGREEVIRELNINIIIIC